jgi:polysaccharide biosynthesis protein PslG
MTRATGSFSLSPRLKAAAAAGIGLALVASGAVTPAQAAPAKAAAPAPITAAFFGTHHAALGKAEPRGWPQASVGSIRLWDNGVAWNQVEMAPGSYDWTRLDALVAQARRHRAGVLLVLGQTPTFYASNMGAIGFYGPGATSMPTTEAAWKGYVQAAAIRNKTVWGNSVDFQVWNEANVTPYWSGTPAQMALLTQWTREALTAAGNTTKLVAPALVTRLSSQQKWIKSFYAQKPGGKNVAQYVDALSFQLYPLATGRPEDSMTLLAQVKSVLKKNRIAKPIYNTEVNYGLVGGTKAGAGAKRISSTAQAGNVARTYILNAQNGVSRVYWYSWDLQKMANTAMVGSNGTTLTAAGRTFGVVRSWILNTRPAGCHKARNGTYTCTFTAGKTVKRAVWKPTGKATKVTVPKKTSSYRTINGTKHRTKAGKKITVGSVPVLLVGRR